VSICRVSDQDYLPFTVLLHEVAFPRARRLIFTRWVLDAAFDLRERLEQDNRRRVVRGGAFNHSRQGKNCPRAGDPFDDALAAFSVLESRARNQVPHRA
jgi:hypothetical protein